jgi:two-component system sensor histidine kinase KdpD
VINANGMTAFPISESRSTPEAQKVRSSSGTNRSPGEKYKLERLILACGSLLGVAAITWVASRLGLTAPPVGFLYLVSVVFAAASGGLLSGTVTSIVAAACLDFFFLPPVYHFNVDDPMDWVALGAFEFTALVITLLQQRAQTRAAEAMAERQNSERLYYAARGVLFLDRDGELGKRISSLIRENFELRGVALFDAPTGVAFVAGNCPPQTDQRVRNAHAQNSDVFDLDTQTWFCALRVGARSVGGLALCGSTLPTLGAQAIASLCAIALERARSLEMETRAEAARQAEQLRSAVIDALAHQIKTPLCVILAASSSLPALGALSETQAELVASIDDQSTKLNDLVSRILGAAALESAQIKPNLEPVLLSELARAAVTCVGDRAQRERFQVSVENGEAHALADGNLMVVALTQIADNALKYSVPKSPITLTVSTGAEEVSVHVHNLGGVIARADFDRIFERFYRTAEARKGPAGTGLGLSITKRIVDAHHGRIWVESGVAEGTNFIIVLPRASGDGAATSQAQEQRGREAV